VGWRGMSGEGLWMRSRWRTAVGYEEVTESFSF
jgi:hypothetical protein